MAVHPTAAPRKVPRTRQLSAQIALATRHHGPGDPRLPELRAELRTEQLAEHIERVVASAPPLTPEQADRLRSLLPAPAGGNGC
jgi:hypothetical protein